MTSGACRKASEKVYLYLDKEMSGFRRWQIKRHLRKCGGCSRSYDFETHFKAAIREKTAVEADPELIGRLRTFLSEHGSDEPQGN